MDLSEQPTCSRLSPLFVAVYSVRNMLQSDGGLGGPPSSTQAGLTPEEILRTENPRVRWTRVSLMTLLFRKSSPLHRFRVAALTVSDAVLAIPITLLWGIRMNWPKKIAFMALFSLSAVTTAVAIIRAMDVSRTTYATGRGGPTYMTLWTAIELFIGEYRQILLHSTLLLVYTADVLPSRQPSGSLPFRSYLHHRLGQPQSRDTAPPNLTKGLCVASSQKRKEILVTRYVIFASCPGLIQKWHLRTAGS